MIETQKVVGSAQPRDQGEPWVHEGVMALSEDLKMGYAETYSAVAGLNQFEDKCTASQAEVAKAMAWVKECKPKLPQNQLSEGFKAFAETNRIQTDASQTVRENIDAAVQKFWQRCDISEIVQQAFYKSILKARVALPDRSIKELGALFVSCIDNSDPYEADKVFCALISGVKDGVFSFERGKAVFESLLETPVWRLSSSRAFQEIVAKAQKDNDADVEAMVHFYKQRCQALIADKKRYKQHNQVGYRIGERARKDLWEMQTPLISGSTAA